jgi:membrane protease YdiL (CAAX protease family)
VFLFLLSRLHDPAATWRFGSLRREFLTDSSTLMNGLWQSITPIAIGAIAAGIYYWSFYQLERPFSLTLVGLLVPPAGIYLWWYRRNAPCEDLIGRRSAWVLCVYAVLYLGATYVLNILAASVLLWLVQFLLPLVLLMLLGERTVSVGFEWKRAFSDPVPLGLASLITAPLLVLVVRDSEQILSMAATWKAAIYFPLSVIYMLLIVALWEEFFFRGVVMHSASRLSGNAAVAIFFSSLLFGTYHVPMRFMNERSEYFGNLLSSVAATINEQFILGLFLGLVVYKCRNVWHAIWLHALINGVSFMYKMSQMIKF